MAYSFEWHRMEFSYCGALSHLALMDVVYPNTTFLSGQIFYSCQTISRRTSRRYVKRNQWIKLNAATTQQVKKVDMIAWVLSLFSHSARGCCEPIFGLLGSSTNQQTHSIHFSGVSITWSWIWIAKRYGTRHGIATTTMRHRYPTASAQPLI